MESTEAPIELENLEAYKPPSHKLPSVDAVVKKVCRPVREITLKSAVSNAFVYLCLKPVCYTGDAYGQFFKAPMISENVVERGAATPAIRSYGESSTFQGRPRPKKGEGSLCKLWLKSCFNLGSSDDQGSDDPEESEESDEPEDSEDSEDSWDDEEDDTKKPKAKKPASKKNEAKYAFLNSLSRFGGGSFETATRGRGESRGGGHFEATAPRPAKEPDIIKGGCKCACLSLSL
jgi:hypothetical protein